MDELYLKAEDKMNKTLFALGSDFASIRAGRANAAILDRISVDYYGVSTPIIQMAAVSVPEPRMLQIQPWDASTLKTIEKAILASDLGLNPSNDGRIIRLNFPALTEERRRELVKEIHKFTEEGKVAIRSIRRDIIEKYKAQKKDGEMTEDDLKDAEKGIQDLTDKYCKEAENLSYKKEKEIMEI
jgi:ribosome recycling factor